MRLRHNKKRNTAFVYEALVRELTKSAVKNNKSRMSTIKTIIKEHFSKESTLKRELKIYKSLCETSGLEEQLAEKMILEAKIEHSKLDKTQIFREQSSLIKVINKTLGMSVFSNFVPNYKNIASVYSIFSDSVGIKDRILLEQKVVEILTKRESKEDSKDPIDNLVYKSFVKRFNERYKNKLNENQKNLLTKYVTSFVDGGLELKVAMNEEIGTLKEKITAAGENTVISEDQEMKRKAEKILELLESYKNKEIDIQMIEEVLKIQELITELEKNDS